MVLTLLSQSHLSLFSSLLSRALLNKISLLLHKSSNFLKMFSLLSRGFISSTISGVSSLWNLGLSGPFPILIQALKPDSNQRVVIGRRYPAFRGFVNSKGHDTLNRL